MATHWSRPSPFSRASLLWAAVLFLAATGAVAAEPTTIVKQTSTITVVQTIWASTAGAAIAAATGSASTDEQSYTDDQAFKNTVLNVSNTVRQNYNASSLVWNETLAQYAQGWTEGCKFEHSNGPYGENLAASYPSASAALTAWANESQHFNFHDPTFTDATGHFTQMVWKSTTSIGCGRQHCGNGTSNSGDLVSGWFVTCEYYPRGNVVGAFKANVDPAVDGSGSDWDDDGMIAQQKNGGGRPKMPLMAWAAPALALVGLAMV